MAGYRTRSKTDSVEVKPITKPNNETLFEYTPKDKTKGTITFTKHDEALLSSPNYLNDTVISFFMFHHWDKKVSADTKKRTYVFNNFFFHKLKTIRAQLKTGDISHSCLDRWLKGVKIFDKDFLIMPVCDRDHWLLVIICYPEHEHNKDYDIIPNKKLKEPAVIVLNSYHGHAPSVKRPLSYFLKYQWHRERRQLKTFKIEDSKQKAIRLIFPQMPQQRNSYNCGVYMLNFYYCFLNNPRESYIRMFRKEDLSNWFEECKIDTKVERRRMKQVVEEERLLWLKNNTNKRKRSDNDYPSDVSQVVVSLSQEKDSSNQHTTTEDKTDDGVVIEID